MSGQAKFRDDEGWIWEAVERSRRTFDAGVARDTAASEARALYFMSRYQTRRCDDFPPDWQRRPAEELIDLWEAATPL